MFVKVVSLGGSVKDMEDDLNVALNEIPKDCFVEDVRIVNHGLAIILCYKPELEEERKPLDEKTIVDRKILEAIDEENRQHYAKHYGIPYKKPRKNKQSS